MHATHTHTPDEVQAAMRYQQLYRKAQPPTSQDQGEMFTILVNTGLSEQELLDVRKAA